MIYLHVMHENNIFLFVIDSVFYSYLCIGDNNRLLHLTKCYPRVVYLIFDKLKT